MWASYAELGLLAIPFAEEHGGFGGGPVETMIVMEAFGRSLALEPYLSTVVLGGGLLRHGGSEAQAAEHLPLVASGERCSPSRTPSGSPATTCSTSPRPPGGTGRASCSTATRAWCSTGTAPTGSW
jgi:alkylation response protein AidB-like acyl-CoA dehydrogenase